MKTLKTLVEDKFLLYDYNSYKIETTHEHNYRNIFQQRAALGKVHLQINEMREYELAKLAHKDIGETWWQGHFSTKKVFIWISLTPTPRYF